MSTMRCPVCGEVLEEKDDWLYRVSFNNSAHTEIVEVEIRSKWCECPSHPDIVIIKKQDLSDLTFRVGKVNDQQSLDGMVKLANIDPAIKAVKKKI